MRPSISQLRALPDVADVMRWSLLFLKFPSIGVYPAAPFLNLRCQSSAVPMASNTKRSVLIRGNETYLAGQGKRGGDITLNFIEGVDNLIHSFFTQWHRAIWNPNTGASSFKSEYEGSFIIFRLDNKDKPIWSYKLKGVFLTNATVPQLTSNSGNMSIGCTFSYDDFEEASV